MRTAESQLKHSNNKLIQLHIQHLSKLSAWKLDPNITRPIKLNNQLIIKTKVKFSKSMKIKLISKLISRIKIRTSHFLNNSNNSKMDLRIQTMIV